MGDREVTAAPTVRRVVTAQSDDGGDVFALDEQVHPIVADGSHSEAGQTVWQIWGSDGVPQLPMGPDVTYTNTLFAPTGGYRVQICEFPARDEGPREPQGTWPPLGTRIVRPETGEAGGEFGGGDYSRLHFTDSVDIMVLLEGEVEFRVGDGTEVMLRAGDVLINNGASHSWRRGSVPCRLAMIALGANRVGADL
jgi:hypothetical protein